MFRDAPDEEMDSDFFAVACQHSVAGLDLLERGFSHADLADIDVRKSWLVDGGLPGGWRG